MLHYFDNKHIEIKTEKGTAVALGKFDGFHLGHMLLIDEVKKLQERGYTGTIFTFDMKKNSVFDVESMHSIISSGEKKELAESFGMDILVEYPFDDEFAGYEPRKFIKDILKDMLHVKYVIAGEDFRFGKNRSGDINLLRAYEKEYGYEVIAIEKKKIGEVTVSSSYIRNLIAEGKMRETAYFLGRPYQVMGTVMHGRKLGRTINIPTANILPRKEKIYPPSGVYSSKIMLETGKSYYGITNIGDNPTVSDERRVTIETHIFDFNEEIYGKKITVQLLDFIRPEQRFESLAALKNQMNKDIALARKNFLA